MAGAETLRQKRELIEIVYLIIATKQIQCFSIFNIFF